MATRLLDLFDTLIDKLDKTPPGDFIGYKKHVSPTETINAGIWHNILFRFSDGDFPTSDRRPPLRAPPRQTAREAGKPIRVRLIPRYANRALRCIVESWHRCWVSYARLGRPPPGGV
ncbi:MAG: hypothetical protein OEZ05_07635 [Nitrospirota bacterium]|nr:hypothetical protein [Nitrospirota bacterium]